MNEQILADIVQYLDLFIDEIFECIVIVDANSRIVSINKSYMQLLKLPKDKIIGKRAQDVIDHTRLHIAVQTGITERGKLQVIRGREFLVDRIPIWRNKEVIGAIGMLVIYGMRDIYKILEFLHSFDSAGEKAETYDNDLVGSKPINPIQWIIGKSKTIDEIKNLAQKAASSHSTVLITGETGTGKGVIAKYIHYASQRANRPFISINSSSIPESLIESELFGYEGGAFTGARKDGKPGQFELANKGTIFLDEIGDMPLTVQAKILQVLETKEIHRVGGTQSRNLDVRIIAATNRPLEKMVLNRTFREDLYYRLNVIRIQIPPLRDRKSDIPLLLDFYLEHFSTALHKPLRSLTSEAIGTLIKYQWPGNIRELVNLTESLTNLVDGTVIQMEDLAYYFRNIAQLQKGASFDTTPPTSSAKGQSGLLPSPNFGQPRHSLRRLKFQHAYPLEHVQNNADSHSPTGVSSISPNGSIKDVMLQHEIEILQEALRRTQGNKAAAAKLLGIHRSTLYQKINKYGLIDFKNMKTVQN